MGSWYWIGVAAGLGTGAGLAIGALLPQGRLGSGAALGALLAVAAGIGIGLLVGDWPEAAGGAIGGLLGALASVPVVSGALRGGGTRAALALLVAAAGLVVAALAFVPGLGYPEAVAVPLLAVRARRRGGGRYAGLRILAKD
ncbi:MAG TPA: hypothetical protein VFB35_00345 [Gaiellaceae bacterium]|nr:hypothetical protein [Gaiellaceae bacterium]